MEKLHFKTSSGIKNILGKDLITDRFIAIFELVKNSYDAKASRVDVIFDNENDKPTILISDNGVGMSKKDLIEKWLFLAYSEKQEGAENTDNRAFVGSKGVGRLSCDSLGGMLVLRTKRQEENIVHVLTVDWTKFEGALEKKFEDIEVNYAEDIPLDDDEISFTELHITQLRHSWFQEDIHKAKLRLQRLKNPFIRDDGFLIYCKNNKKQSDHESVVVNEIGEVLKGKTISLNAVVSEKISISLIDRGKLIYTISKENDGLLKDVEINITINYLTPSAKNNFKRRMGIDAVNYGNIFIYKNNFRVNPYGEMNYDLFNLNVRKAQGYSRYIGTREMLGYIAINDKHNYFLETSSRNNGFIYNMYMAELERFYIGEIHKPFEKYIHLIKWGEDYKSKEEIYFDDVSSGSEAEKFKRSLHKKNEYIINYFSDNLKFEEADPKTQLKSIINNLSNANDKKIVKSVALKIEDISSENKEKDVLLIKQENKIKHLTQQNKNLLNLRTKESYSEQVSHHFTKMVDSLSYSLEDLSKLKSLLITSESIFLLDTAINIIKKTELEMGMFRTVLLKSDMDVRSPQRVNLFEIVNWYFAERNKAISALKVINILKDNSYLPNWLLHCNVLDFMMFLENFYQNAKSHAARYIEFSFEDNKLVISNDSSPIDDDVITKIFDLGFSTKPSGTGIGMYQIKEFCHRNRMTISVKNEKNKVVFIIEKE